MVTVMPRARSASTNSVSADELGPLGDGDPHETIDDTHAAANGRNNNRRMTHTSEGALAGSVYRRRPGVRRAAGQGGVDIQ